MILHPLYRQSCGMKNDLAPNVNNAKDEKKALKRRHALTHSHLTLHQLRKAAAEVRPQQAIPASQERHLGDKRHQREQTGIKNYEGSEISPYLRADSLTYDHYGCRQKTRDPRARDKRLYYLWCQQHKLPVCATSS